VTREPGAPSGPGATTPGPGVPPEPGAPSGPAVPGWRGRAQALRRPRVLVPSVIALVVIVALAVAGATIGTGHGAPHNLGKAKNFTLGVLGHPGEQISLRSMANRPVIVNFFASWCEPCQRETPLIARFYRDGGQRPAIIGVDVNDSASKAMKFVRKSGVTYPVVADPAPMTAAIAYNLPGLPATFFLNARHLIVKRVYGPVTQAELAAGTRLMAGPAG
jgi:cytochrome c biogenesis protein CcmG, thiol:disulfide interchange protein DsbE